MKPISCKFNLWHDYIILNNYVENIKEIRLWMKEQGFVFNKDDTRLSDTWIKKTEFGDIIFDDCNLISWHTWDHEVKVCKKCKKIVNSFNINVAKKELIEKIVKADQISRDKSWAKEQLKEIKNEN